MRLGLLGKNIQHSKSQEQYEKILGHKLEYIKFDYPSEAEIPTLDEIFSQVDGLSITSPYKLHFVNEVDLDEISKNFYAINCIKKTKSGYAATLTDYFAIETILNNFFEYKNFENIFILGSGSMSKLVKFYLNKGKYNFKQYSRKSDGEITHLDFSNFKDSLVINTCSREYVFKGKLAESSTFWDLNYNFPKHKNISNFQDVNYIDGLEMLNLQAQEALRFWNS